MMQGRLKQTVVQLFGLWYELWKSQERGRKHICQRPLVDLLKDTPFFQPGIRLFEAVF
jgi:hypothetical protein